MHIISHCEYCAGKDICTTYSNNIPIPMSYNNIVFLVKCDNFILPSNTVVGTSIADVKSTFDQCNTCNFKNKCKYCNDKDMYKSIDRVLADFNEIKMTARVGCKSYVQIESPKDSITDNHKTHKSKFFSLIQF